MPCSACSSPAMAFHDTNCVISHAHAMTHSAAYIAFLFQADALNQDSEQYILMQQT